MITLLHFSDSHLFADKTRLLKGIRPYDSFAAVLKDAKTLNPDVSGIILGGDVAQDGNASTYRYVADMMQLWNAPVMVSPGNHDAPDILSLNLIPPLSAGNGYSDHLNLGQWQVVTISTSRTRTITGFISEAELTRLQQILENTLEINTVIALHHHPIPVGSRWMDDIGLENSHQLWEIIKRHPQVKVTLCGHIHQEFDSTFAGVRVLGSPSTSVQFKPGETHFSMDDLSSGYRWIELLDHGEINTGINRVEGYIPPDLNNTIPY